MSTKDLSAVQEVPEAVHFLKRFSSEIPVINSATKLGFATYDNLKQYSKISSYALSKVEDTGLYFVAAAKPILEKVHPQAQYLDQLACRGLDVIEAKIPVLLKPTEELLADARKIYSSPIEAGYQHIDTIRALGVDAVSSAKAYGLNKANEYILRTDGLVEKYLPASGDADKTAEIPESMYEGVSNLSYKIVSRTYQSAKHMLLIQTLSQQSVSSLISALELLQMLKEYSHKNIQEVVDDATTKANWVWEELNKLPTDDESLKNFEMRTWSLARRMTLGLVNACHMTAGQLTRAPQAYRDSLRSASNYASQLYVQFNNATLGETAESFLTEAKKRLQVVQSIVRDLIIKSTEIEVKPSADISSADTKTEVK